MKIFGPAKFALIMVLSIIIFGIIFFLTERRTERFGGRQDRIAPESEKLSPAKSDARPDYLFLDLSGRQKLPRYVDLSIGESLWIRKNNGEQSLMKVKNVLAQSRNTAVPRTQVLLEIDGQEFTAYCGMLRSGGSGIEPIESNGIKVAVEITNLVFSKITRKQSFNSYAAFRLRKDVRLAIWDPEQPMMANSQGLFIVNQPKWTRERYGNWLHKTGYGLHSAIDIFATHSGAQEEVLSPVDGVSYCYNKEAPPDSTSVMKHVNIHSAFEVGPRHEKILFRFLHLSRILVDDGGQVRKGQVIGYTGHTGFAPSVGDHLHFEIRLNPSLLGMEFDDHILASIPVNPYPFLLEWWNNSCVRSKY